MLKRYMLQGVRRCKSGVKKFYCENTMPFAKGAFAKIF